MTSLSRMILMMTVMMTTYFDMESAVTAEALRLVSSVTKGILSEL